MRIAEHQHRPVGEARGLGNADDARTARVRQRECTDAHEGHVFTPSCSMRSIASPRPGQRAEPVLR